MAKIEPNIKDVTSVFKPEVKEVTRIPIAREELEINAIAESPFMLLEMELTLSKRNAKIIQTGIEIANGAQLNASAIAIVPKPT